MRRNCDLESHNYIVGVYNDLENAIKNGINEEYSRGGKYGAFIYRSLINNPIGTKPTSLIIYNGKDISLDEARDIFIKLKDLFANAKI